MALMNRITHAASFAAALLIANGCNTLTDVDAPDVVQPADVASALGARALRAGAISTFTDAFSGGPLFSRGQVMLSGTLADEFTAMHTNEESDKRILPDFGFGFSAYLTLQQARLYLGNAIAALQTYVPTARADMGQLFALRGYVVLFFGENMCSGVPLSTVVDGQMVFEEGLTTTELLERAIQNFDSTLVYATDNPNYLNLARIGKGRALLSLGRFADAAAAVNGVPTTTFTYRTEQSATVQQNGIYLGTYINRAWSVSNNEGGNGLDFIAANDPRVVTQGIGPSSYDPTLTTFGAVKYNAYTSPIVLASGIEARLIEAEAAFQTNPTNNSPTGNGWLGILNALRTDAITPSLPPLADPGNTAARENLIFRERAFWLFGTGHRHGDLRRLVRQYGRGAESVFPTGPYRAGIVYGTAVTFTTVPDERNNPNYSGCFDRNP